MKIKFYLKILNDIVCNSNWIQINWIKFNWVSIEFDLKKINMIQIGA